MIHIGTSGWSYKHWDETFYPKEFTGTKRLKFYSSIFSTVEINTTFYHLPLEGVVQNWKKTVPKDFIFSVKASRFITHTKKLKDIDESLNLFFQRVELLGNKLGPILFQLPPSFQKDKERLEGILSLLNGYEAVFEFRHTTWFSDEIYDLLKKYNVGLCISDLKGTLSPIETTSSFAYIRLHGPKRSPYKGSYSKRQLLAWKKRIEAWSGQKISTYCYFDNDEKAYATQDAYHLLTEIIQDFSIK